MDNFPGKEALKTFLGKVSLFNKADNSVLSDLAEKTIFASFAADETIIRKGDLGDTMYLIFSGRLKVHDGEHKVAELEKGEFFGELSLLDSEPRSMSVSALEPSVLGSINRDAFYEVMKQFPGMTRDIISELNKRLRKQNDVLISEYKTKEEQLKELVKIRTRELEQKNEQLEITMDNLKKSQQQLIQSEKLASLGQLTAGIAHEIKNPLNFVNNFSALSNELIEELKDVKTEEERNELLNDIRINLQKINQHGKRADSIVKNMLEHSRTGSGEKQLININQLCEEYFNLAYHGTRANNPDFNCEIEKDFFAGLPEINIIPQDISRVLINIFSNAFYAVREKNERPDVKKENYFPKVSLLTRFHKAESGDSISISVKDNGTGIPADVKEKIFEPFFTTKPTGQGTGLGLSLSYDIVKAHGGNIVVESKEGDGSEFIVSLPA